MTKIKFQNYLFKFSIERFKNNKLINPLIDRLIINVVFRP